MRGYRPNLLKRIRFCENLQKSVWFSEKSASKANSAQLCSWNFLQNCQKGKNFADAAKNYTKSARFAQALIKMKLNTNFCAWLGEKCPTDSKDPELFYDKKKHFKELKRYQLNWLRTPNMRLHYRVQTNES